MRPFKEPRSTILEGRAPLFDKEFAPNHGHAVPISAGKTPIVRVTANNTGPFTFTGTNSYIIGKDILGVIDPGPENAQHLDALLMAIDSRPVSHIFVSHTHLDHSPLAKKLKEATGATIIAEGPHKAARHLHLGETNPMEASNDQDFAPDIEAAHHQRFDNGEWAIDVLHTPGHMANHSAFALPDDHIVFTADHIMAWATTIVAPPDGSMSAYMKSLEMMLDRDDALYLPGHGGSIEKPHAFVRGLKSHRILRERAILKRLKAGDRYIPDIVAVLYRQVDKRLHGAAALSVLAHMEDLIEKGEVTPDGPFGVYTAFMPL